MTARCQFRVRRRHQERWLLTGLIAMWSFALIAGNATDAPAATLYLLGPDGGAVSLDGRSLGTFPLTEPLSLPAGRYEIRCRLRGYLPYEDTLEIKDDESWVRVRVRMVPLSRRSAVTSNLLLAGLGQHYVGRKYEGWLWNAVEIGGLLTALTGEISRQNSRDDYLVLRDQYRQAVTDLEILRLRVETEAAFADMKDAEDLRNTGLLVAAGAVVVSVLDVWLRFPSIEAGHGTVMPTGGRDALSSLSPGDSRGLGGWGQNGVHLGVRMRF